MTDIKPSTLVIGYGNPGRQDDGLGPALIDILEQHEFSATTLQPNALHAKALHLQSSYQLTVEDAFDICEFDQVVFVDASLNAEAPYSFQEVDQIDDSLMGSHSLTPEAVMKLCKTLYSKTPKAYILGIRGYEFDHFEEKLSSVALENLQAAQCFLTTWLERPHHA